MVKSYTAVGLRAPLKMSICGVNDSLSQLKPKEPSQLAEGELAALTVEGRNGNVYVLTAYADGMELYDRAAMRRVWKLLK